MICPKCGGTMTAYNDFVPYYMCDDCGYVMFAV